MGATYQHSDGRLAFGTMIYGVINFAAVALGPMRIIPPFAIFGILTLFISIGPLVGISVVWIAQLGCDKRPFTWWAIALFMLAIALASWINILIFIEASAAV